MIYRLSRDAGTAGRSNRQWCESWKYRYAAANASIAAATETVSTNAHPKGLSICLLTTRPMPLFQRRRRFSSMDGKRKELRKLVNLSYVSDSVRPSMVDFAGLRDSLWWRRFAGEMSDVPTGFDGHHFVASVARRAAFVRCSVPGGGAGTSGRQRHGDKAEF